ncbi:MAG: hypothetical protein H7Z75_04320 [Ferruginibacter sp.]|nr:hypothetical protein [Cytophagales bacterium]
MLQALTKLLVFIGVILVCLPGLAAPVLLSLRLIKQSPSRCATSPTIVFLTEKVQWKRAEGAYFNGENDWEVFFELETDLEPLPLVAVEITLPGVKIARVIVGKTDVPFTQQGDRVRLQLLDDRNITGEIETLYHSPRGGVPIWFRHNWEARKNGKYLEGRYPKEALAAANNYLLACHEILLQMGDMSGLNQKFAGELILMGVEVAAPRGHLDYPVHWHLQHWEHAYDRFRKPQWAYKQCLIPHYYLDSLGRITRDEMSEVRKLEWDRYQTKNLREGDSYQWLDAEGRPIFREKIHNGGLEFRRPDGQVWSLRPDPRGGHLAVWGYQGQEPVCKAWVEDNAEQGEIKLRLELHQRGKKVESWQDHYRYDPFTGNRLPAASTAPQR